MVTEIKTNPFFIHSTNMEQMQNPGNTAGSVAPYNANVIPKVTARVPIDVHLLE